MLGRYELGFTTWAGAAKALGLPEEPMPSFPFEVLYKLYEDKPPVPCRVEDVRSNGVRFRIVEIVP